MAHTIFEDNAETYLTATLTDSATSFTVNDSSALPAPGTGQIAYATLKRKLTGAKEVISYTGNSGGTISGVTRNVNSEGALSFGVGDLVEIRVPEIVLDQFMQRQGDNGQGDNDFTGDVYWSNTAGPVILNEAATTTNPTLIPNQAELDTGWGWASDQLTAVLGGADIFDIKTTELTLNAAAHAIDHTGATSLTLRTDSNLLVISSDDDGGGTGEIDFNITAATQFNMNAALGFYAENAAGPSILNEAATTTNPTLIPNRAELDTGWGWASDELWAVLGGVAQLRIASDDAAELSLYNYVDDATVGPVVKLIRSTSLAGAANDILGSIEFSGDNSTPAETVFASITTDIITATALSEDGAMRLGVMDGGTVGNFLELYAAGTPSGYWNLSDTQFHALNAAGPALLNETPSSTNPTVVPDRADPDTGLGWVSNNNWSLVSGGTETVRMSAADMALKQVSGTFQGDNAAGPCIINEAATTTNPTLIPNKAEVDTGWGWASDELHAVLGGVDTASFEALQLALPVAAYAIDHEGATSLTINTDSNLLVISVDGDGGGTGIIDFAASGADQFHIDAGQLYAENAAGPTIQNEAATTTNPTLVPNRAEEDTGWGWASDTLAAVLGGAYVWELSTTDLRSTATGGAQLLHETASDTNPTLIPYADDTNTGIGGDGSDSLSLIAAGTQVMEVLSTGVNLLDLLLQRPEIKDYGITYTTASSSAGTLTLDYSSAQVYQVTLTENVTTITINNPPASGTYGEISVRFVQAAAASYTLTYAAAYKFQGGTDHAMTSTNNAVDWVVFRTKDGGTTWEVDFGQDYS